MSDEFDAYDFSEFTEQDFAAIDAALARAHGGPAIQIALEDSPLNKFLSWKKYLAVTDLVSPLWCEVQHEYSLYGERNKPLHLRPSTFTSRNGKQIRVQQRVAHTNDRRLKHGKSVHKALEDELRPDKLVVHVISEEERFGLRLLRLIDGFNELVSNGITRELPVFAITHAQVVLGVIDEVLRSPLTPPNEDRVISSSSPPPSQEQQLPSLPAQQITPPPLEPPPTNPQDLYELRIVDYKTRRSLTIPPDEDSLSPRLQVMMYHRMLSSVLEPEAFDFDLLWDRLNLDPSKHFSAQFLKDVQWEQRQVDPTDCNLHLNRLVSEWISTVQRKRAGLMGVSQQLQLVYRRSGKQPEKGKHKATETEAIDDPLEALVLQEELYLTLAIEESLSEMRREEAAQIARHVAQHVKQVGPSSVGRTSAIWKDLISPLDSGQTDPTLAWAIQQSLLTYAHEVVAQAPADQLQQANAAHGGTHAGKVKLDVDVCSLDVDGTKPVVNAPEEQARDGTARNISPIIGKKEFRMNDHELDAHIADVLQWWFGARPPRGVDVSQTNRCFTCEYQDSCEWREQKAREAAAALRMRT